MSLNKSIFFLLLCIGNLFACGCTDIPNASNGAMRINNQYDKNDQELSKKFDEQLKQLNEVLKYETNIHTQLSHVVVFEIDSIVQLDNLNFELTKKQNIIKLEK